MLDSLYISNFRLFKELKIEQLGRVNLITGKNNSGKTCLLEALRIYASNAAPNLLYALISERGQDWELRLKAQNEFLISEVHLRYLFHGYQLPETGKTPIKIGSLNNKRDHLKLYINLFQLVEKKEGNILVRINKPSQNIFNVENLRLVLEVENRGKKIRGIMLNTLINTNLGGGSRKIFEKESHFNIQTVFTHGISDNDVMVLWDNINIKPNLRKEVFNALRLIDPQIQEIVLVNRHHSGVTPILIYSDEKQIPLKSLGDGVTHIFHIILALVNAHNGFLLIDEFENGLHYSVQAKLWALIFKLAKNLNIQVFATTHSRDCIFSFYSAWQNNVADGVFFRLDNYNEETGVMFYDQESLGDALEMDGEMR